MDATTIFPTIDNFKENRTKKDGKKQTPDQAMKTAISFLKKLVSSLPAFASCMQLIVSPGGHLLFESKDFTFSLFPEFFGLSKEGLEDGQIIMLDPSWIGEKEVFRNVSVLRKEEMQRDANYWSDGHMLFAGNTPKSLSTYVRLHEDNFLTHALTGFIEKFRSPTAEHVSFNNLPVFLDGPKNKVVKIGSGHFELKKLDFVVKNTDKKKETSFIVSDSSILAIEKDGDIVAVLMGYNPDKVPADMLPSGSWQVKGYSSTPAITIPLKNALQAIERQPAETAETAQEEKSVHETGKELSQVVSSFNDGLNDRIEAFNQEVAEQRAELPATDTTIEKTTVKLDKVFTIQYPTGRWGFVGNIPANLAYIGIDGRQVTDQESESIISSSNPAMVAKQLNVKNLSFDSEVNALAYAQNMGFEVNGNNHHIEQPATTKQPAIVEHTTRKGKTLRGIIRHDMTKEQSQAIDPYTFKKDGGYFIREKYLDELTPALELPVEITEDWTPCFEKWRHGGWYVTNIQYKSGACGCVSNNYDDGKWRIACGDYDQTFKSRDAAARAERKIAMLESIPVKSSDLTPALELPPAKPEPQGYKNGSTWYGGRYDSNLSTTDICKKMRQHLKEESLCNSLFVGCKFSVRKDHHKSITISVLEMGFNPLNPEYIKHQKEDGGQNYGESWLSIDGKKFFDRIDILLDSYNFDGSDTQSDYFHVNFYKYVHLENDLSQKFHADLENNLEQAVNDYRKIVVDSWPACSRCGEKTDRVHDTEDGEHTGLCWECFYPHYQAEQEAKKESYRIEAEETARLIAQISDVELMPADEMIMICQPRLNKCSSIEEYNEQRDNGDFYEVQGKITHRAQLTTAQYDIFAENLLASLPWLAGKGGTDSTADLPGTDDLSFFQLTPEQQEEWKAHAFSLFVEVTAPDRETVYLDPQGYSYARYFGFAATPALELDEQTEDMMCALEFSDAPSFDSEPPAPIRFEIGKTYFTRSICDHNCIFSITIAKRTEKTVTTDDGKACRPKVRKNWKGEYVESISAGNWSMAHGWDATDTEELLPDWKTPQKEQPDKGHAQQVDEALLLLDNIIQDIEDVPAVNQPTTTAKASTACAPANRWNNQAPANSPGPGAVKIAPVEKPVTIDNSRELWSAQGMTATKSHGAPCVAISNPAATIVASFMPASPNTASESRIAEDKKPDPPHASRRDKGCAFDIPCADRPLVVPSNPELRLDYPLKSDMPVRTTAPAVQSDVRVRTAPKAASLPEKDEYFYPTPTSLVWAMTGKIKGKPRTILDPSAGKGDLLEKIKDGYSHRGAELYAIEIDNNLRAILQSKKIQVLDSDFLAWSGPDKFDCILMNPPFNRGDEHLLKAIEIMYSGQIICLLNAETLRNPYTNTRKDLARKLEELGAEIEYKGKQFLGAERKTAVDVAIVSIVIERQVEDDLFKGATDSAHDCAETIADNHEVSTGKRIEEMVARYREVVRLSTETILSYYRNYNKVGQYVSLNDESKTLWTPQKGQELTAKVQSLVNGTVRKIRVNYWRLTLDLPEVRERMTQKRRAEFEEKLRANESMDFTESNIRQFLINLISGYTKTLEDGVAEVFDLMTLRHCWDDGLITENIHYFNGWKTNSAYRVGQRVILPIRASYGNPFIGWSGWQLDYRAEQTLSDIDLVMSYFNGGREYQRLGDAVKEAFKSGEQSGQSTFFKFKCHKKGTIHLSFLDENILRRFNLSACKGKGWLPGDYGTKPFKDMTAGEKEVVKSFETEGEAGYTVNLDRPLFDATFNPIALLEAA